RRRSWTCPTSAPRTARTGRRDARTRTEPYAPGAGRRCSCRWSRRVVALVLAEVEDHLAVNVPELARGQRPDRSRALRPVSGQRRDGRVRLEPGHAGVLLCGAPPSGGDVLCRRVATRVRGVAERGEGWP